MWQRKEFAEIGNVSKEAIRHYYKIGLLKPDHNLRGHKLYKEIDLKRLKKIVILKSFGFSLMEIKDFIEKEEHQATLKYPSNIFKDKMLEEFRNHLNVLRKRRERIIDSEKILTKMIESITLEFFQFVHKDKIISWDTLDWPIK